MEETEDPREPTVKSLTTRILIINVGAIHIGPNIVCSYAYDVEIPVRRVPNASNVLLQPQRLIDYT